MTQPSIYGGRPNTPPPGSEAAERRVARFHGHARRLFWSALVLIAVAGATAYYYGNLPEPFQDWMLLAAAGAVVLLLVLIPFLVWVSRVYTITTERVIVRWGVLRRHRVELPHVRGYQVALRRGPLQRIWGCGTITLDNGIDAPVRLVNVPNARLVGEVLGDQVEVSQILAHRGAQAGGVSGTSFEAGAGIPPRPPAPSATQQRPPTR